MLTEPLPTTLDVRKAAARGVTVSGLLKLSDMGRLREALASDQGQVEAICAFAKDEERRLTVTVSVDARVEVVCQRCLESMAIEVHSEHALGIVSDDEFARQLPSHLEPWVVEEEQGDLWSLVEDELILSIPFASYHESEECKQLLKDYSQPAPVDGGEAVDNPFKVLEQLKPGNK